MNRSRKDLLVGFFFTFIVASLGWFISFSRLLFFTLLLICCWKPFYKVFWKRARAKKSDKKKIPFGCVDDGMYIYMYTLKGSLDPIFTLPSDVRFLLSVYFNYIYFFFLARSYSVCSSFRLFFSLLSLRQMFLLVNDSVSELCVVFACFSLLPCFVAYVAYAFFSHSVSIFLIFLFLIFFFHPNRISFSFSSFTSHAQPFFFAYQQYRRAALFRRFC